MMQAVRTSNIYIINNNNNSVCMCVCVREKRIVTLGSCDEVKDSSRDTTHKIRKNIYFYFSFFSSQNK